MGLRPAHRVLHPRSLISHDRSTPRARCSRARPIPDVQGVALTQEVNNYQIFTAINDIEDDSINQNSVVGQDFSIDNSER